MAGGKQVLRGVVCSMGFTERDTEANMQREVMSLRRRGGQNHSTPKTRGQGQVMDGGGG